jgi:hypothetical protein
MIIAATAQDPCERTGFRLRRIFPSATRGTLVGEQAVVIEFRGGVGTVSMAMSA